MRIQFFIISIWLINSVPASAQMMKPNKYAEGVSIDKGMKFVGLTFSANSRKAENESGLLAYIVDQDKSSFRINFDPGIVIRQNLATGIGFTYGHSEEYSTLKASDGTLTDVKIFERDFIVRPYIKNYLPIGKGKKFYIVIPTEIILGNSSNVKESTTNGILTRTYSDKFLYGINMRPGILAFIVNNFGFEVNVGAFGLGGSNEKIKTTGQPDGNVKTSDFDLKINLLQLSFGFAFYFR